MRTSVVLTVLLVALVVGSRASPIPTSTTATVEIRSEASAEETPQETTTAATTSEERSGSSDRLADDETAPVTVPSELPPPPIKATYFAQRNVAGPKRFMRMSDESADSTMDNGSDSDEGGSAQERVGEVGAILTVIRIASEVGEAVLPVVIKEVETSPVGEVIIGVIGGGGAAAVNAAELPAGPYQILDKAKEFIRNRGAQM